MRYTLSDFNEFVEISKKSETLNLNNDTMKKIECLLQQVGAPEYSKSPQFKNKPLNFNNNFKKKNKNNFYNDDQWDNLKNFQTTEFNKREGLDLNIDKLRKSLNMLTTNNYTNIYNNIKQEFDFVFTNKTLNDFNTLSCGTSFKLTCNGNDIISFL